MNRNIEQTRLKIEAGIAAAADRGEVSDAGTVLAKLRQKVEDMGLAKATTAITQR